MKKLLLFLVLAGALCLGAAQKPPRITEVSGKCASVGEVEIVTPKKIPVVDVAAEELQKILSVASGQKIPVVKSPTAGKFSIILGDNALLQKEGVDVKKLPEEGYYMIRKGNKLFLAGQDDPRNNPVKRIYIFHKRGTLSAVYDFLERFAGVHFYFPGKHGTVIPRKGGLFLPEKIRIMERPDRAMRTTYFGTQCSWYDDKVSFKEGWNLQQLRMRYSEVTHPFCHGLTRLNYVERFAKTKPEYFALETDGQRFVQGKRPGFSGQLCFSGSVREQIYQDAKRYFEGATPQSVTGRTYWSESLAFGKSFCVMPQDWMYWCNCEKCRKIAPGGREEAYSNPKYRQAISNFMWKFTSEIAERLTKDGFDCTINQMAYSPYDMVPDVKLAPNVQVQVAVNGLGGDSVQDKRDMEKMKVWAEKMGHPVMLWTYAQGKHMRKNIPGIAPMMPRHLGRFIDRCAPYFDGGFFEAESDYFLFSYLNYFIIARKLWNSSLDTEKLLADHYRAMFGKGAPMMQKFYEELEEIWTKKILGKVEMTSIGPVTKVPEAYEIWTKICSPAKMAEFHKLFDSAKRAAGSDREVAERIEFLRANLLGPIENSLKTWQNAQTALDFWQLPLNRKGFLRTLSGAPNEVTTSFVVRKEKETLVFTFDCQEPQMKDMKVNARKNGDADLWKDSAIELFINPSADRTNYYQIIINAAGFVTMYRFGSGKGQIVPAGFVKTRAVQKADSWQLEVRLPIAFAGLDKRDAVPFNVGRHRALKTASVKHIYSHWSPIHKPEKGFHDLRIWGLLTLEDKSSNLLQNDDFANGKEKWHLWIQGGAKSGSSHSFDEKIFISGGQSIHFKNREGGRLNAVQYIENLKPGRKYRLSYFIRCENLKGKGGAGAYIYFGNNFGFPLPRRHILGTRDWSREVHTFTVPANLAKDAKPTVGLWIWTAGGEAWFDCVRIEEVK